MTKTNLVEPEVWIEYLKLRNGIYVSGANMIIPKGVRARQIHNGKTGVTVLEYLMQ